jgi:hypothetical protein
MGRRSAVTDLAGLALLGWAMLLGYVSVPLMLSRGLLWDDGISLLGALLAAAHLAAALGVMRRAGGPAGWACGWQGLGCSGAEWCWSRWLRAS